MIGICLELDLPAAGSDLVIGIYFVSKSSNFSPGEMAQMACL